MSTRGRLWPACRTGFIGRFGVDFEFGRTITAAECPGCNRRQRKLVRADRFWICSGDELKLLFADEFEHCGLVRCKLQMMRSVTRRLQGGGSVPCSPPG